MKKNRLLILLVMVALASAVLTYTIYEIVLVVEVKEIRMDLNATYDQKIGFNVDTDAIHFGKIPAGGSSLRPIKVTNTKPWKVNVHLHVLGEISEYVIIDEKKFILAGHESRDIEVKAFLPLNATIKDYMGILRVETRLQLI